MTVIYKKMTQTQMIVVGYLLLILLGSILLMLPVSSRDGNMTSFADALFTSTSASCVTGLVVQDTYLHWSFFGQLIILILIQIGGMGFMTIGVCVAILLRRKIGLKVRGILQESINSIQIGGIVKLTKKIIKGTLFFESIGAVLLMIRFIPEFGIGRGIWYGIFHSISAFCNAGFDLMGENGAYQSLIRYSDDWLVNTVIMLLIIIGGIGFLVWDDLSVKKFQWKKYHLHTKIVLSTTGFLIIGGAVLFLILEKNNVLAGMPVKEQILCSLFHSVTARTAGFNTTDTGALTEGSKLVTMILMFIGGSPGSTAGGMKTTTFSVLILNAIATFRSQENAGAFGRRLEYHVIKNAATIAMLYFALFFGGGIAISVYEGLPLLDCLYEAASAVGTVGLTLGITPELHVFSQVVLIILMYLGRVGGLTLIYAVFSGRNKGNAKLPLEKITVG